MLCSLEEYYNYCCAVCSSGDIESLQRDHIVPKSLGGTDDDGNMQMLCYVCNSKLKKAIDVPFTFTPKEPKYNAFDWVDSRREFKFLLKHIRLDSLAGLYEHKTTGKPIYVINRKLYMDIIASGFENNVGGYADYITTRIIKFVLTHTDEEREDDILYKLGS